MKHLLVLSERSSRAASARTRVYRFLPLLQRDGWASRVLVVWPELHHGRSARDILAGRLTPIRTALLAPRYDAVLVHRYFPRQPWVTRLLRRRARRLVFDCDESYHVDERGNPVPVRAVHCLDLLTRLADLTVVSNAFLAERSRKVTERVTVIPTTVDIGRYPLRCHGPHDPIVIGWIGSGGAEEYLRALEGAFDRLHARYRGRVRLQVVTSLAYRPRLRTALPVQHVEWALARETDYFAEFDIGIMPLTDNERSRGKAAYKALEYMAAGVPVVASPVGVNPDVIADGVNGFLAAGEDEWVDRLSILVDDPEIRGRFGGRGRALVERSFDSCAWYPRFKEAVTAEPAAPATEAAGGVTGARPGELPCDL